VPQQFLYYPKVGPLFEQVRGKGMPETMKSDWLGNTCMLYGIRKKNLNCPYADRFPFIAAFKKISKFIIG
jgi:hypothetical protein